MKFWVTAMKFGQAMLMIPVIVAVTLSTSLADSPVTLPKGWTHDASMARARAVMTERELIICFTWMDECQASRQFTRHFLSDRSLTRQLDGEFELVHLDLSRVPESHSSNLLREEYGVTTFPTVVLADAGGTPWAFTGLRPGGIEEFQHHIGDLRAREEERRLLLQEASELEGTERADVLVAALPDLGSLQTARFYGDMMREAVSLYPDAEEDSVRELQWQLIDLTYMEDVRELETSADLEGMISRTNDYLAEPGMDEGRRQAALMTRYELHLRQEDLENVWHTLREVIRVNPWNREGREASEILQALGQKAQRMVFQETDS